MCICLCVRVFKDGCFVTRLVDLLWVFFLSAILGAEFSFLLWPSILLLISEQLSSSLQRVKLNKWSNNRRKKMKKKHFFEMTWEDYWCTSHDYSTILSWTDFYQIDLGILDIIVVIPFSYSIQQPGGEVKKLSPKQYPFMLISKNYWNTNCKGKQNWWRRCNHSKLLHTFSFLSLILI